jgi:hypothetical protein
VYWLYGIETKLTKELSLLFPQIKLHKGLPDNFEAFFKTSEGGGCIVIDDLMRELLDHSGLATLFSRESRHCGYSLICIFHNLFAPGKDRTTFLRNTHYICLFKNPLDSSSAYALGHKILPKNSTTFVQIYEHCCRDPYSYLLIDGSQKCPQVNRLRSDIFKGYQKVYVPKEWLL